VPCLLHRGWGRIRQHSVSERGPEWGESEASNGYAAVADLLEQLTQIRSNRSCQGTPRHRSTQHISAERVDCCINAQARGDAAIMMGTMQKVV
jgi:hypothetical protein